MNQLQAVRAVIHHRYGTSTVSGSFVGFISGNLVAEREVILFPLCKLSVLLHGMKSTTSETANIKYSPTTLVKIYGAYCRSCAVLFQVEEFRKRVKMKYRLHYDL